MIRDKRNPAEYIHAAPSEHGSLANQKHHKYEKLQWSLDIKYRYSTHTEEPAVLHWVQEHKQVVVQTSRQTNKQIRTDASAKCSHRYRYVSMSHRELLWSVVQRGLHILSHSHFAPAWVQKVGTWHFSQCRHVSPYLTTYNTIVPNRSFVFSKSC